MEGKGRFDGQPTRSDFLDGHREEDREFSGEGAEDWNPLAAAPVLAHAGPDYSMPVRRRAPAKRQFIRNAGRAGSRSSSSSASCEIASSKSCPSHSVVYVSTGMSRVSASSFSI